MNPDYSGLFQSILQLSQAIISIRDELVEKRQLVAAVSRGKMMNCSSLKALLEVRRHKKQMAGRNEPVHENGFMRKQRSTYTLVDLVKELGFTETIHCWPSELAVFETESFAVMTAKAREIEALHVGEKTVVFGDLSDEQMVLVLRGLDYVTQQRLTRVCQRWQYVILTGIDHLFIDWPAIDRGRRLGDFRIIQGRHTSDHSVSGQHPKPNFSAVHQVTFHAGFRKDFGFVFPDLLKLFQRCPNLTLITLFKLPLEGLAKLTVDSGLTEHWNQSPNMQVQILDGMVPVFCIKNEKLVMTFLDENDSTTSFLHVLLEERADCYVSVVDAIFTEHNTLGQYLFDARLWPYPAEQLVWLKQSASHLDPFCNSESQISLDFNEFVRQLLRLPEKEPFWSHLDQSAYDRMQESVRNMIASWLMKCRPPHVSPPPVPFGFKRLTFNGTRNMMVPVNYDAFV